MSGTNQNFNSEQWARHIEAQKTAQRRHSPILEKQAKNDPFGKKK
jgi:hypothetical protein